ncbi:hypothetical protein F5888DRAFT_1052937 [Russula emetica]|nr:hypothetical protein F5888DRAFT_1052937 [Russula emetica]
MEMLACPDTRIMSVHLRRRQNSVWTSHLIPRIHGVCVHGDGPRHTPTPTSASTTQTTPTPKHNYVHYDTSALSPPAHLNPTLRLTCPTCGHSTCSKQNTTQIILTPSDIPCLTASLRPSLSPVVRLRCTLGPTSRPHKLYRVGVSLSHSQQLKYSHWSIATPLRDIQTCICLWISRVSCAWAE